MRIVLALFLAASCAAPARAGDWPREIEGPVLAHPVKVRDGDTIEVEALIWPMQTVRVRSASGGSTRPSCGGPARPRRRRRRPRAIGLRRWSERGRSV
ncbi:hypothetical protein [Aureimonas flava]|uniref:hypothetical protein n=1 Tax=Aureimonas flava TaxID=2320271 RepID=UPI001FE09CD3|nr:hypothetical protein [Aureimonas flava]